MQSVCGTELTTKAAQFYLTRAEWELSKAIYMFELEREKKNNLVRVNFILPDSDALVIKEMNKKQTISAMKELARPLLWDKNKDFVLSLSKDEPLKKDCFTHSLEDMGFFPEVKIYIDYVPEIDLW
eukprot:CAMPEP_0115006074 /NCGR_PEP_ID=MMETSP0216-20121206/20265_1 /TAXON_ID=223996 /ORGANISM="Protocruzia adherens, Strain Boccale" /LENGTH=125 /DNA_ID=CAMNT_0002372551 /DNA_START=16 /DNA_END=390 /DNA_ORIENTATION=-